MQISHTEIAYSVPLNERVYNCTSITEKKVITITLVSISVTDLIG